MTALFIASLVAAVFSCGWSLALAWTRRAVQKALADAEANEIARRQASDLDVTKGMVVCYSCRFTPDEMLSLAGRIAKDANRLAARRANQAVAS